MNKEYDDAPCSVPSNVFEGICLYSQVRFKTGGPVMLVLEVHPKGTSVFCKWFDTLHHVQTAHFSVDELEVV